MFSKLSRSHGACPVECHINILEELLDEANNPDFMGFDNGGWRETLELKALGAADSF